MKRVYFLLFIVSTVVHSQTNVGITGTVNGVYINEIHYDNAGTDVNEFVEIAGPAGTNLSSYVISLYRDNGTVYDTETLSGSIDDEGSGVGAISFSIAGIQNGSADGLALSNGGTDIQLLSYEGTLTASHGPANGLTSVDIGVEENGAPIGSSLDYDETTMVWIAISDDTPGDFAQGPPTLATDDFSSISFNIYPNPTSTGFVNIETNSESDLNIQVFNVLGKRILNQSISNEQLDVSALRTGVYIMKISQNSNTTTKKLVIK